MSIDTVVFKRPAGKATTEFPVAKGCTDGEWTFSPGRDFKRIGNTSTNHFF